MAICFFFTDPLMDINCQIEKLESREISMDEAIDYIDNFLDIREDLEPYVKIQLDNLIKKVDNYKNK